MKNSLTIAETINAALENGKKVIADNPGITSVTYEFTDFSLEDVLTAGHFDTALGKASIHLGRMHLLHFTGDSSGYVYVHIYSRKVVVEQSITEEAL